ncbi:hypothetical protein AAVH_36899, partial [Aphelenchoides avenae]
PSPNRTLQKSVDSPARRLRAYDNDGRPSVSWNRCRSHSVNTSRRSTYRLQNMFYYALLLLLILSDECSATSQGPAGGQQPVGQQPGGQPAGSGGGGQPGDGGNEKCSDGNFVIAPCDAATNTCIDDPTLACETIAGSAWC